MKRVVGLLAMVLLAGSLAIGPTVAQDATPVALLSGADLGLSEYTVEVTDEGFVAAPELAAGRVLVTVTNNASDAEKSPFFIRLEDGDTIEDLQTSFVAINAFFETGEAEGDPFAFLFESFIAGGTRAEVGHSSQVILDLPPGNYAIADFNFAAPPVPVTVTGEMPAELPAIEANATVTAVDTDDTFDFALEGEVGSGTQSRERQHTTAFHRIRALSRGLHDH